jgi:hypothetical protein
MIGRVTALAALSGLLGTYAFAQDPRVEVSGTAGWTFSDGVNVGAIDDSPIRVDPKDAFSWGLRIGFNLSPNLEMGALFSLQSTDLEASGIINRSIGQKIYNYHGYFAYNFGDPEAKARPYLLGGLGATQYGGLSTAAGDIGGETQFSTTWAAGVLCGTAVGTTWHSAQVKGLERREPSAVTVETWRRWAPTLAGSVPPVASTGGAKRACEPATSPRVWLRSPWQALQPPLMSGEPLMWRPPAAAGMTAPPASTVPGWQPLQSCCERIWE